MWKWMMKISNTDCDWISLARLYLDATAGRYLSGLIHNANNSCHIIAMATGLLRMDGGNNLTAKLDRIDDADTGLQAIFKAVIFRSDLLDRTPRTVHLPEVIQGEIDFFHNCLFFKHNIETRVSISQTLHPVTLPPIALLYCLEAGITNAVEACESTGRAGPFPLDVTISSEGESTRISITSPVPLPENTIPFASGIPAREDHLGLGLIIARNLCTMLQWTVSLTGDDTSCTYTLVIPSQKSDFTTS